MSVNRPYRRTCRQLIDGSYSNDGQWMYLLHPKFANDPRHYVRAFLLLQQDIIDLFTYIEPCDKNAETYSHRIQQLLMRSCVEIEANFTAILSENGYHRVGKENLNVGHYKLINISHKLSSFKVRVPGWKGSESVRSPFSAWAHGAPLSWYQAYNQSKHDRHNNFEKATFGALIDAFCGLNILLSSQFMLEEYGPGDKSISIEGSDYIYEGNDGMDPAIGGMLRIEFPSDWTDEERYDFKWQDIRSLEDPFLKFDYAAHE